MKPFRLAALSLALLTAFSLTGCDDSGTPQASAPAPAADSNPGATAKPDRAQLAALADNHLLIAKQERNGRTYTSVTPLDLEGRKRELARIIGGATITETTLKSAEEMLRG